MANFSQPHFDRLALYEPIHDILCMTDRVLEEDIAPQVRSYLLQIRTSGLALWDGLQQMESASRPQGAFTAPEARVLLVDDNAINLAVAEGVLAPLGLQTDLAESGTECIQKVQAVPYDLIFLDHLMPDMDGVAVTRWIRQHLPSYAKVPIIALTANTAPEARGLFLQAGMNDMVYKPVSFQTLREKLRQWLPVEKLRPDKEELPEEPEDCLPEIPELNLTDALSLVGDGMLLRTILEQYYRGIERNAKRLRQLWDAQDLQALTLETHSLKSTSKQIGAEHLSSQAALLEMAGSNGNLAYFHDHFDAFLEEYRALGAILKPHFGETNRDSAPPSAAQTLHLLEEMQNALEEFDAVHMDDVLEALSDSAGRPQTAALLEQLREAVDGCELDAAAELISAWKHLLSEET